MIDWFNFWVNEVCGNAWIAFAITGMLYAMIGIMGRFSYYLLVMMMILYGITFGIAMGGFLVYCPLVILSLLYFVFQGFKFLVRE